MLTVIQLLQELTRFGSVSGDEGALATHLAALAAPLADEITTDTLGNLIVHKKGNGRKVMLSAHMDTIGLIVTHIDDNGFLRFAGVGGVHADVLAGVSVVFANGARGLLSREEKTDLKDLNLSHCFIDIGAGSREEAARLVSIGDRAFFWGEPFETNGRIVSPYLDNRIGCVVLLMTLARVKDIQNDLYFVFSVQEEVGLRGARTSAFSIDPDWALAVDVTSTGDCPEVKHNSEVKLGGGAAIKLMDRSVISHPVVVRHLEAVAKEGGIAHQYDVLQAGGTDVGAIHQSRGGVPSGGISIPTRYIHTPTEMALLADVEACVSLLTAALERAFASA